MSPGDEPATYKALGISGAQYIGAAGTRHFEPDGVAFWRHFREAQGPRSRRLTSTYADRDAAALVPH